MAVWNVLPSTILQRVGSDPAMLAAALAGGIGVTAIAAVGQDKDEPAPPAAENPQDAAAAAASSPPRPVLLEPGAAAAAPLVSGDTLTAVTLGEADTTDLSAPETARVLVEPMPATVLRPYVAMPSPMELQAEPTGPAEQVVDPAEPAQPLVLAEAPSAEASEQSSSLESVPPPPEAAILAPQPEPVDVAEASEAASPALDTELAISPGPVVEAELPAVTVSEVAQAEAAPESPTQDLLASLAQSEDGSAETGSGEAAFAAIPVPELPPPAELAADEPARAAAPTAGRSAFDLAFADLKMPAAQAAVAPEPATPSDPAPSALAATPAPAPAVASMEFDLAAVPALAPAEAGSAFVRPEAANAAPAPRSAERQPSGNRYRLTGNGIEFQIPAVLFGEELGTVPLRIGSTNLVSVRLGDLLALVAERMDPAAYARLSGSRNAEEYVPFSTLRDAGIDLRYDAAHDRLILGE